MVHVKSLLPDVPPLPPMNLYTFLFDLQDIPDHVLYIDGLSGQKRTRNEFKSRVELAKTALGTKTEQGGLGLHPDDSMVAILGENCIEYPTIVVALCGLAVPFAPCSAYATQYELAHSLRLSKATHIFVHSNLLETALRAAKEVKIPTSRIFILEGKAKNGYISLDDLVGRAKSKNLTPVATKPVAKGQLAFLLFSSGTTGLPKAVALSHDNVITSAIQGGIWMTTVMESPHPFPMPSNGQLHMTLGFLPSYHTFGLHSHCIRPLMAPTTVVLIPRWNTELALHLIPKYKITNLPSVPSIIHQLATSPKLAETDMSSVIWMSSGASYLPPSLAEKMSKQIPGEFKLAQGYGLSECTITAITAPNEGQLQGRLRANPEATGVLIPSMEARTVREDGTEADYDESGELWLKGPNVALGYYGNPKATKETFVDGWVKTGDQFKVDREGYFYFQDRAKDTMKISGMQVSPAEIEDAILSQPGGLVSDVAVAGVHIMVKGRANSKDERVPRAWVVLTAKGKKLGNEKVAKELDSWVKERLSRYKQLRGGIGFVPEIPKTATGKVLRRELIEKYSPKTSAKL